MIAEKYRLERPLARGGMGEVWTARHLQLDERIAIKFMDVTLPEQAEARTRFAREARAAARLRSPHVVQILDHGVDGEVPFIVMELLQGEHLGERLRRRGALPLAEVAVFTEQVARALHRAHRAGIVHRDLKPANVFLARVDDEEIAKVLDFGIVKAMGLVGDDVTKANVLMGSPNYMSPEQARGARNVDHRADLWSLGVILYRAVTGSLPFEGASAVDVIVQICSAPLPPASRARKGLAPEVDAFFARALHRDPDRRFSNARELAAAFSALARGDAGGRAESAPATPRDADLATSVMERRPSPRPPPTEGLPQAGHADEIDAFLDQAFTALVDPSRSGNSGLAPPAAPGDSPPRLPSDPGVSGERPRGDSTVHLGSIRWQARPGDRAADAAPVSRTAVSPGAPPASSSSAEVWRLIDLGFSALKRGDQARTRQCWLEALELDPSNRMLELNLRRLDALALRRR